MGGLPFPLGIWIVPIYFRIIVDSAVYGLFVAMNQEGHVYLLNPGESVSLECNFHADDYDLFEYPVLWRKTQQSEEAQINIMGTLMEPFLLSNRFEVTFNSNASRYRLVLTISDVTHTDNGNYTCEVRAPEAVILGHVTHHVFVRAPVHTVTILLEANRSTSASDGKSTPGGATTSPGKIPQVPTVSVRSVHLREGRPTTLGCLCLGGYPPPSLAIHVGRKDLSADFSFRNSASLSGDKGLRTMNYRTERWSSRFTARAEDDESMIKCIARVPGLDPKVETVKLYVEYSPKIICYTTTAQIGDRNVRLQCDIASRPNYSSLVWIIDANGTTVKEKEVVQEHWTHVTERHDGVVVAELFTRKIKPEHFRKYTLVVRNIVDSTTKIVELLQRFRSTTERPLSDATAGNHDDQGSRIHAHIQTLESEKSSSSLSSSSSSSSYPKRLTAKDPAIAIVCLCCQYYGHSISAIVLFVLRLLCCR